MMLNLKMYSLILPCPESQNHAVERMMEASSGKNMSKIYQLR